MYQIFGNPGYLYRPTQYQSLVSSGYQYLKSRIHRIDRLHKNNLINATKSDEVYE